MRTRRFNTTGVCIPAKHYMVDISERVREIKKLVDEGAYLTISRPRQYGKTTTLVALKSALEMEYTVLSLDFQQLSSAVYQSEGSFTQALARAIVAAYEFEGVLIPEKTIAALEGLNAEDERYVVLNDLFDIVEGWAEMSDDGIVLMIDEVDYSTNFHVFFDFLAHLRAGYLSRDMDGFETFQSVILAGLTDVRCLEPKAGPDGVHKLYSPWNIATHLPVDMSLTEGGIQGMLDDYEADHRIVMDTAAIAKVIHEHTSGYPFLVSRICQLLDERLSKEMGTHEAWTRRGVDKAVKLILSGDDILPRSLVRDLGDFPKLREAIRSSLMEGTRLPWNPGRDITQMLESGLLKRDGNTVHVANRVFETMLYDLFLSDKELRGNAFSRAGDFDRSELTQDGRLSVSLLMERFAETYTDLSGPLADRFNGADGRESFLLYLRSVICGAGSYYIEASARDETRTDVVVDCLGELYVIELRVWRWPWDGEVDERLMREYLERFGLETGYVLGFDLTEDKVPGMRLIRMGDRLLYEAVL